MAQTFMQAKVFHGEVLLRRAMASDLTTFFDQQRDPATYQMLGFGPEDPNDRAAHDAKWGMHLINPEIKVYTILYSLEGMPLDTVRIAGNIQTFYRAPSPILEVGYLIGRDFWGRGIASAALKLILGSTKERPIRASCAADNQASVRVLQKAGFKEQSRAVVYGNARKREIVQRHFLLG